MCRKRMDDGAIGFAALFGVLLIIVIGAFGAVACRKASQAT